MNSNKYILNSIKNTLESKKMSQATLANLIGTTRSDISMTFKNLELDKSITTKKLFKILDVLGLEFSFFVK